MPWVTISLRAGSMRRQMAAARANNFGMHLLLSD